MGVFQLTSLLFVVVTMIELVAVVLVRIAFDWKMLGVYDTPNGLRMVLKLLGKEEIPLKKPLKIAPDEESLGKIRKRQAFFEEKQERSDNVVPEVWKKFRNGRKERKYLPIVVKIDILAFFLFNISYIIFNYLYWKIMY